MPHHLYFHHSSRTKRKGRRFFDCFRHRKEITSGYKKTWWSGVTTLELAKFIEYIIQLSANRVMHFANGMLINKYDWLHLKQIIFDNQDAQLIEDASKQLDKSLQSSK